MEQNIQDISHLLSRSGYSAECENTHRLATLALLIFENTNISISESVGRAINFEREKHKEKENYDSINQMLKKYKWWYFPEFPETILRKLCKNATHLNSAKVNDMICEYFHKNDCKNIKSMANKWKKSAYFKKQKNNLNELVHIYKAQCFNSVITISMSIIEGVIRDFIRVKNRSFYRFASVKKAFIDLVNSSNTFFSDEIDIINEILNKLDKMFNGGFSPDKAETVSDLVRDKRMHGFAYRKQKEVTALKMWLFIDEIYYVINVLEDTES